MKKITVDPKTKRVRVQTINDKPTKTQQQFQDAVNVNKIIEKYKRTGDRSFIESTKTGVYADTTMFKDYQSAKNKVIEADQAFLTIPSTIRERFQHDPQQLISFLADPKNKEESINLGLRPKPAVVHEGGKKDEPTKT
nr:MAG: internal scaffolding protein [Microvirus sp.]